MPPAPDADAPELALAALHPEVLTEPIPPHLLRAARGPEPRRRRGGWGGLELGTGMGSPFLRFALVFGLGVGVGVGWPLRDPLGQASTQPGTSLAREAALAHVNFSPDILGPELPPDQPAHKAAWLTRELALPVPPPLLDTQGYTLIGARRLGNAREPVVQFMYHNPQGQRLTLYVRAAAPDTRPPGPGGGEFQFAEEGPVAVAYWTAGALSFAISAGLDRSGIMRVSRLAQAQLNKPGGGA